MILVNLPTVVLSSLTYLEPDIKKSVVCNPPSRLCSVTVKPIIGIFNNVFDVIPRLVNVRSFHLSLYIIQVIWTPLDYSVENSSYLFIHSTLDKTTKPSLVIMWFPSLDFRMASRCWLVNIFFVQCLFWLVTPIN